MRFSRQLLNSGWSLLLGTNDTVSPPFSSKISRYSEPISIVVSKQSATKAGENTSSFLAPFLAQSSTTLSENGVSHFLSSRD